MAQVIVRADLRTYWSVETDAALKNINDAAKNVVVKDNHLNQ